ncbi:DNA-binding protein [Paucilactobacillus hokkaidonensis JCM 18461]|uniref:DNA-binding protein n=2 Tax=Paucilactobacillus hokkaidonensis TaxID=1193095 RepID=A0A0A1GS97_9LACO|nr:ferritin-like domain-containing protein [Paucilactobacillus hokkaidonensis]KRO09373.1 stress induced DNA binding protein [Paucilactobacillus hokkaidonensis]BAP84880.1 DNA-binding protein [Paucilactobacillus hokkaidonensis JCM 18461]
MTDVDAKYEAEVKQADVDHHTPTAGAMTGHILSNLLVNNVKLHQTLWYVKGLESLQLKPLYEQLIEQGRQDFDQLANVLLDENEIAPSTMAEYGEYSMLEEDGRNKYRAVAEQVDITVHDYATQNMFIDRAIVLAQKETRPAMAAFLTTLRGHNNHAIRTLQAVLGKDAWDGLVEEDDED